MLYNRISGGKLSNLVNEYGLDRRDLDSLGQMVFRPENGDAFVKFPREVFLKLSGDSTRVDLEFCKALVKRFNTVTPYFQMRLAESNMLWNQFPSITIHYEAAEEYKNILLSQVGVASRQMMFIFNMKGDIWMRFYDPKKKLMPQKNEKITQALFNALGLSIRGNILVDRTLDGLEINKKYENYFRFIYDPRFPSGITKSEYME